MRMTTLPNSLPDDLFAHLIRLAGVSQAITTPREIRLAAQEGGADARAAGAIGAMSPDERRDALDAAATRFLVPRYAARAAHLAASRLARDFRLCVAPR